MPSRTLVVLILLLWVASTGWHLWWQYGPADAVGEPPPVVIDLSDEAGKPVKWSVRMEGKRLGETMSQVKYLPESDTYKLLSEFRQDRPDRDGSSGGVWRFPLKSLDSTYHVDREGELLEIECTITLDLTGTNLEVKADVKGDVVDRRWRPTWEVVAGPMNYKRKAPEVDLAGRGSVLNPLLLVSRLGNVRPGMRWTMPLFDPLAVSLEGAAGQRAQSARRVEAVVRAEDRAIDFRGREYPTYVIDYQGIDEEFSARTWVRRADGLVLETEARLQDDRRKDTFYHLVQKRMGD